MRKLFWTVALVGGVVAFVGFDVVGATVRRARESVRATLTSKIPLRTQLAEARAQVDAYAENVIRGEIAAENLKETLETTSREVAARRGGLDRERVALAALKADLVRGGQAVLADAPVVPQPAKPSDADRAAMRRARDFQAASTILERRERDLAGLTRDYEATQREVAAAKSGQVRLADEVRVLEAEIAALDARTEVAQTRKAFDAVIDKSGFGDAEARITSIRNAIKEQNMKLEYYAMKADAVRDAESVDGFGGGSAIDAIDAVLQPVVPAAPAAR